MELGGSGGMPPRKILKIDAKILQFKDISTFMKCFYSATCNMLLAKACVYRKDSVSSSSHMMHPLTISGNRHVGAQRRFIMADSFKRISGGRGATPRSCEIFTI